MSLSMITTSMLLLASNTAINIEKPLDLTNGQERYEETCIACHGEKGKPTMPGIPDFTSKKSPLKKTDAILFQNITEGLERPDADLAMPPLGGNPELTEKDVKDIIGYMRKTFLKK
ncbi:cytochrome c [Kordiimonas sp. SCSIO 12603]|uniref:c-type cytochrome n=1 Tax=Kordiimonas sp. SCSIO 12603 TaxID=2829596 RepID=UPI002101E4FF|nr:cytochrome c [Kordiimonas sp. SCSIO 12603]UTW59472.1 cytochrome c [Kordiimonas sp. SCSIO 12603]